MKSNLIEVLDIQGTSAVCFEADSIQNVGKLYDGRLLRITSKGLIDYNENLKSDYDEEEKFRFVVAKNPEERDVLLKVETVKCYLRDHEMNSKVLELNPYQSVRWLRNLIQKERKMPVTLIVNQHVLTQDGDSLLHYIYENCIIHILENQQPQKIISVLYTKEPGSQSEIFKLENISTSDTVDSLTKSISVLTTIPFENLLLVYGGRILAKEQLISEYRLLSNGIIYAVDDRKYMKKVTKEQFQTRVEEIRKSKESYKILMRKIKQSPKKTQQIKPKVAAVNRERDEKADSTELFKESEMKIQSQEFEQFNRLGNNLQNKTASKPQGEEKKAGTPPNSPIYIFNRAQSYQSVSSELKEGRVVTKQTDVYQDPYGFIHEHSQQKTSFKNGRTKIVDVDIAEDEEGNVVKIEKDIINIKKDSVTGNTIKFETDIIEDAGSRVIVKKQEVRDSEGNLIKQDTEVIKGQGSTKQIKKVEREFIKEGENLVQVNTEILQDNKGEPYKIQTDIRETIEDDKRGLVTQHSKDIKEQNGVTSVIERNVTKDKQGNIVEFKTDIIKITEDEDGNIYKHERNQIDSIYKTVVIERDIVTTPQGDVISKQTNRKVVEQDSNNNVIRHETDIIQESDGRAIIIEKSSVEDAEGNVIKNQSQVFQIDLDESEKPKVVICQEEPQVVQIEGQREPVINGGTQVSVDELGNTHTHEKQLIEKQGKTTFVDRDTIEDPRGKVIRIQTDIVEIEGQEDGNMHKHKSEIIEQQNKTTMVETDQIVDIDGVLVRKQKDTIEIEAGDDGSVFKHQKDVIEEEGKVKVIEKTVVEDAEGNIIKSETKVTEIEDKQDTVEVREKQQKIQAVPADQVQDNQQIEREIEIVQDQQGNVMRREQRVTQDEQGHKTFVDRCTIENADGNIVREQTQVINVDQSGEVPKVHRHVVDYSESDNKVVIEQSTSKENIDGSVIKAATQTLQIEQREDGTIQKTETDVVEENGTTVIHVTNIVQNEQGEVISKTQNQVSLDNGENKENVIPVEGEDLERVNVDRATNVDSDGNTHVVQTETRNSAGHEIQIQREYVTDPQGNLLKTQTGVIDVEELEDGTTKLSAVDIIQEGNVTTVVENSSVSDVNGNQLKSESGSLRIEELEGGFKRKDKQNYIEVDGIKLKVQKQTYEDSEGHVIQQKSQTTQLVDKYGEQGNQIVGEGFKRKEQQIKQDSQGNYHFHEKQVIDNEQGKTTLVESEVIRNEDNELVKATTDVIEITHLEDGSVIRHQVNIVEEPGKMVVAETNALENAEGQRLTGQVQSVVVTEAENGDIIKQQTDIVMEDFQKLIVEKVVIEDAFGNIIKSQSTKKTIYTDANGVEQSRQSQSYKANQIEIQGEPSTIQKKVNVDREGNIETSERLTTIKGEGDSQVIEVVDVKVKEAEDGTLLDQSLNVTKIAKNQDGQVEITKENIPIEGNFDQYQQVESEIREAEPNEPKSQSNVELIERQVVEDEAGNVHTFEKQVIDKGEGSKTVIKSEIVEDSQGHLVSINTNVVDTEQLEEGRIFKHVTEIVSGEKVISTQTFTIENADGGVLTEKTTKIEVSENDGLISTNRVDITREEGRVTVDNLDLLEDEEGNVIEKNSNKLDIQNTEEAVREQARKIARAEIDGQITGIVKQSHEDQQGNLHRIQTQTIQDHGKRYIVDSETVENKEGGVIQAQTEILEEQVLENGKVEKHKTVIKEHGGKVEVVEYSQIKDDDASLNLLEEEKPVEGLAYQPEVTITKVEGEVQEGDTVVVGLAYQPEVAICKVEGDQSVEVLAYQPEVTITKVEGEVQEGDTVVVGLAYQPEVAICKVEGDQSVEVLAYQPEVTITKVEGEVQEGDTVVVGLAYQPEVAICKVEGDQSVEVLAYQPEVTITKVEGEVQEGDTVVVGLAYQPEVAICKVEGDQSVEVLAYQPEVTITKVEGEVQEGDTVVVGLAYQPEVAICKVEGDQSVEVLAYQPEVTITKVEGEVQEGDTVVVGLAYQPEVAICKVEGDQSVEVLAYQPEVTITKVEGEVQEGDTVVVGLAYQPEVAICKVEGDQSVEVLAYQPEVTITKVEGEVQEGDTVVVGLAYQPEVCKVEGDQSVEGLAYQPEVTITKVEGEVQEGDTVVVGLAYQPEVCKVEEVQQVEGDQPVEGLAQQPEVAICKVEEVQQVEGDQPVEGLAQQPEVAICKVEEVQQVEGDQPVEGLAQQPEVAICKVEEVQQVEGDQPVEGLAQQPEVAICKVEEVQQVEGDQPVEGLAQQPEVAICKVEEVQQVEGDQPVVQQPEVATTKVETQVQTVQKPKSQPLNIDPAFKAQLRETLLTTLQNNLEPFSIILIGQSGERTTLTVKHDDILSEVASQLGAIIGKQKQNIQFFLKGEALPEYDMVSDFEIHPGTNLYYTTK